MDRIKVGVLRGGPSSEYDVSLQTGGSVLQHLPKEKYHALDILIGKDGIWHVRGMPTEPSRILNKVDAVFNALHGEYGEDGTVQNTLDTFGVHYTGSGKLGSAIAMNKAMTKERATQLNIRVPKHELLKVADDLEARVCDIFKHFGPPLVTKPLSSGSSVGVTLTKNLDELIQGVYKAFEYSTRVMVEEYIKGREATCGVIENFRGEEIYSMFPIEIIPPKENNFFDYDAKYSGKTEEICPGNFTEEEKEKLQQYARDIHHALGLRHYSRSDFIVSPNGIYFLEVNTLPGLTEESLFPKALDAIGCSLPEFLDHITSLALERK